MSTGIPQGSPVSPILFLFFNKDLVDFCARGTGKVSAIGFVDDVNILVVGNSTESNCRVLEHVHHGCTAWADRHGAAFAPHKYELMHLTRSPRRFNMAAGVNLEGITKAPQPTLRILGILLDPKLRWGPHMKRTAERATQQNRALSAITGSTWGATFDKARLIYNTVVRPVITYRPTVWSPLDSLLRPAHRRWIRDTLDQQQQHCLRSVTGGFRATSRKQLESEAAVPPLRAHMARLQLQARARMEASGVRTEIQEACEQLRRQLARRPGRRRRTYISPGQARHCWAESILWPQRPLESTKGSLGLPPWADSHPAATPPPGTPPRTVWQARLLSEQWCWERWHELHGGPPPQVQLLDPDPGGGDNWKPDKMPYRASLRLCAGLSKAQSSILTQMRTGKIGLATFLCRRQVPGFPTPAFCCGAQWETAKHVVLECPRLQ